jgi:hypothetical protein
MALRPLWQRKSLDTDAVPALRAAAPEGGHMTEQERELDRLKHQIETMRRKMQRVHLICLDHSTCECSCSVMILDVLGSDR